MHRTQRIILRSLLDGLGSQQLLFEKLDKIQAHAHSQVADIMVLADQFMELITNQKG